MYSKTILKQIIFAVTLLLSGIIYGQAVKEKTYITVKGKIIDANTKEPVVFANIIITGTNTGTITNTNGEFSIKVPEEKDSLVITSLGYKNKTVSVTDLNKKKNIIKLSPAIIQLSEIMIRPVEANFIVKNAVSKIKNNYPVKPYMLTAFYRETVKRRNKYVAVAEAVLDTYKAAYNNSFDNDKIKILIARKRTDYKKNDTLVVKLSGGPLALFYLDFVKYPGEILNKDIFQLYNYKLGGFVVIDGRPAYVINFTQKPGTGIPLYEGKFFIDVSTEAFIGADFRITESKLKDASGYLVRKKPLGANVDIEKTFYHTRYRFINGHWYLTYVRYELVIFIKWKKKHFRSRYTTVSEMAVTDIDTVNIIKFKRSNIKVKDVFVEKAGNFENPEFWGDYNVIEPEKPIKNAIKKMGRKLKRKTKVSLK